MKNILSILFKLILGFVSLLVVALGLAIVLGVTVDLSFLKPGVEKAAQNTLGKEVKINGPVVFEFSSWTAIDIHDVKIKNIPNASTSDILSAGEARLEIKLMPLLKGEIHIGEIIAEDVTLNLENDVNGKANWVLADSTAKVETNTTKESSTHFIHFGGIDKLSFKNIVVTYYDAAIQKTINAELTSMTGEISPGKPIVLDINGNINKTLFQMNLQGLPYDNLMDKSEPWEFKLKGEIGGRKLTAKGTFINDKTPEVKLAFGVKDVDIGLILSTLGLVEGMSASVGDAAFKVSLKGQSLKEVLRESSMYFIVKEGQWKIKLPKSKNEFDITHLTGEITVEKGNNVVMNLNGNLQDAPIKLKITGSPLVDYVERPDEIPLTIDAELANAKLQFASTVALPLTTKDLKFSLKASGDRLDNLNHLFGLDLPPVGPIDIDTFMHVTDKGYDLSKLDIKVGHTTLNGTLELDLEQKKPALDIALVSNTIQINDFIFKKKASKKKEKKKTTKKKLTKKEKAKIRHLLSREVLGAIHANVKIEAKQILSGKDKLGSASALVTLKNSRLAVEPLLLNIPGGAVRIDFSFLPKNNMATIDLKANIKKFDIGVIARRAKPGTDMGGHLYLNAALHSVTPDIRNMMKHAKGHFDFGVIPKNFSAGIIDLWAVNLLSAIIHKETEEDKSQVNCFIMRFGMLDGLMQDKVVYMDTSKMVVAGEAEVNFQTETINMHMAPKAKKPEFFSLAMPIQIDGTFKDFGLDLNMVDIFGTVISFITSPVIVPIERIFVDTLPSDGKDACVEAWKHVSKKRVEEKVEKKSLNIHEQHFKMLEGK